MRQSENITIRAAEFRDVSFIAWTIFTAARGYLLRGWFDIALDQPEEFCLAYIQHLVLDPIDTSWNWSKFHIAEVEGEPVSALGGYSGKFDYQNIVRSLEKASHAMGLTTDDHADIMKRGNFVFDCLSEEDNFWTIEHGATVAKARQHGCFGILLDHLIGEGLRAGLIKAQVTYLIGHIQIESACAKRGFTVVEDRRTSEFLAATGAPGFRRVMRTAG